ncbi:transmembrane 220 family protein [Elongatibacter sediminis]|uniref:Transmembrane 220 family protein n=1 Tax=Elongatibacter sediminis TaxID=3119006 RepID=A0AAW9RAT8_9GAMM
MFVLMAAIQLNDPDPVYWVAVYAAVAIVSLAAATGRSMPRFGLIALGVVLAGMLIAAPGFVEYLRHDYWTEIGGAMRADAPWIESAREFIGLVMAAAALLFLRKRGA